MHSKMRKCFPAIVLLGRLKLASKGIHVLVAT